MDNSVQNNQFSEDDIKKIQDHFHQLILYRNRPNIEFINDNDKVLPTIPNEVMSESEWYGVPGMYGGFSYQLIERDGKPLLTSSSWCRIVGGSGQAHEITTDGCVLIEEGFV